MVIESLVDAIDEFKVVMEEYDKACEYTFTVILTDITLTVLADVIEPSAETINKIIFSYIFIAFGLVRFSNYTIEMVSAWDEYKTIKSFIH